MKKGFKSIVLLLLAVIIPLSVAYAACDHNWKKTNRVYDAEYYQFNNKQHIYRKWFVYKCTKCDAETDYGEGVDTFQNHHIKTTNLVCKSAVFPHNSRQHRTETWYWEKCTDCNYWREQSDGVDTYSNHTWKNKGTATFQYYADINGATQHSKVYLQPRICTTSGCGYLGDTLVKQKENHVYGEIEYEWRNNKWHAFQRCVCGKRKDL